MRRHSLRTRALVSAGAVALATATSLAFLAPAASAGVANVTVNTPNSFLTASTPNQNYGNITVVEAAAGDIPANSDVCITIDGANVTWDLDGTAPAVADNNTAAAAVTPVGRTADTLKMHVTTASTGSAATFTISGIRVDVGAATGPVTAKAGDCVATPIASGLKVGYVGTIGRLAGSDRYATAQQIAEAGGCVTPGKPVVIARGDNFPDALAASYLAGINGVPILLTAPNSLPNETTAALQHIGATSVVLIGGDQAISPAIATLLASKPAYNCPAGTTTGSNLSVDRAFGADRYGTARSVALKGGVAGAADEALAGGACSAVKTVIVASGENFPDALAAGPLAYTGSKGCGDDKPIPLLLTQKGALPTATSSTITDLAGADPIQVILMGGTAAVSDSVKSAIDALANVSVTRVSGADRQATAIELNKLLGDTASGDFDGLTVAVARGDNFPDALAAAPFAGSGHFPLYLSASSSSLGSAVASAISAYTNPNLFTRGELLGGTTALTEAVASQLGAALAAQT